MNDKNNAFRAVQEKYRIADVAGDLRIRLHRVGGSLRANSIAGNGAGKDAFAVYEDSNTWHDFMLGIGGDITDLVAYVKYNGDKYRALCELMPECKQAHNFAREISKREEFTKDIKRLSDELLTSDKPVNVQAREYLHSRGITDETIKALQIGLDYGFPSQIRIRFPYWDMSGKTLRYYTTRAFKGDDSNKYMKASLKAFPFLKNSPLGLNTVKQNSDFCIVTEGMFDWLNCYQQGFAALSPNGCDFGSLWPEALEVIRHHFKSVILAFDNDKAGWEATIKAAEILMKERISFRVAQIINVKDVAEYCENGGKIIDLVNNSRDGFKWYLDHIKPAMDFDSLTPEQKDDAIEKCSRFIRTVCSYTKTAAIQEVLDRLRNYFPKEWFKSLCKEATQGLSEKDVCDNIIAKYKLMFNEKTGFYEFTREGFWQKQDDTTIMGYIAEMYGIHAKGNKVVSTFKLLKMRAEVNSSKPINGLNKKCCVTFYNGTLYIDPKTGETHFENDHNPEDYITVRLPYFYNPEASCPKWEKFIEDVTDGREDYQKVLQEYAGYVLSPECKYQTALMLKGEGSNGKSVFNGIMKAVFGDVKGECNGYISYAEPSKFSKDFRLMKFKDSWLNISSETENNMIGGEGVFKKIVSGETIEDSYKHKDPFAFTPRTKFIMCCNRFPKVSDTSEGFMRRWMIVPFENHYVKGSKIRENSNDKLLNPNLLNELKSELSGIFNWVLKGLQRLIAQDGFTEIMNHDQLIKEFAAANNHLYCFIEECFSQFGKQTHRHNIYAVYHNWADQSGVIPIPVNRFYSSLKALLDIYGVKVTEQGRIWLIDGQIEQEEDVQEAEIVEKQVCETVNGIVEILNTPNSGKQDVSRTVQEVTDRQLK